MAMTGSAAAQSADSVVASDGSGDYTSIQNAVDDASDGDRIEVAPGTYEQHTTVSKDVIIAAQDGAVIANTSTVAAEYSGIQARSAFHIIGQAEPTISGFTLTDWKFGIYAGSSEGSWTARELTINGGETGVAAFQSLGDWTVTQTLLEENTDEAIGAVNSNGQWTIDNTTIRGAGTAIDTPDSDGDFVIQNTTILDVADGIDVERATSAWLIRNTVVRNSSEDPIDANKITGAGTIRGATINQSSEDGIKIEKTSGDWLIESTNITNISDDGIDAYKSQGGTIQDTTVEYIGGSEINLYNTGGDWDIQRLKIRDTGKNGINAAAGNVSSSLAIDNITVHDTNQHGLNLYNSSSQWSVDRSNITRTNLTAVHAVSTNHNWNITESTLSNGTGDAVDATGAVEGNVSYNYWGAADGPSGEFCGSGGEIVGSATMYPYYTDSSLTDLSSATTSGEVKITDSCLIPNDISSSNEQTLTLTVAQMSADGQSDEVTITMPETVSVDSVGTPEAVGTPYEVDITNNGNPITLEVNPDEPTETVDFVIKVPMKLSSSGDQN